MTVYRLKLNFGEVAAELEVDDGVTVTIEPGEEEEEPEALRWGSED